MDPVLKDIIKEELEKLLKVNFIYPRRMRNGKIV